MIVWCVEERVKRNTFLASVYGGEKTISSFCPHCQMEKLHLFRLLCDVVTNFQTNQEEVTLIVDPEKAKFKNYTEDEPGEGLGILCIQRVAAGLRRFQ